MIWLEHLHWQLQMQFERHLLSWLHLCLLVKLIVVRVLRYSPPASVDEHLPPTSPQLTKPRQPLSKCASTLHALSKSAPFLPTKPVASLLSSTRPAFAIQA